VHDYHLIPLGAELRKLGARQRLGFFLHTPFPPADILETLPGHQELMQALFQYDVVGLQTQPDVERLQGYVQRYAGGAVDGEQLRVQGRRLVLRAFPIGIDAAQFQKVAMSAEGMREGGRMREALNGRALVIGVDRLDYSKGLLRRMAGYELLLERYPALHRQVELLQIAPISRGELKAYKDFRRELEHAAAGINGRYAQADWTPVRYLNRALPRRALGGLYRASRVGLVTPVRDGMNLVAKEYVAAQDPADPGVLVLSRFAGAAQQMHEALLVNPYDEAAMAEALHQALVMPLAERRERHAALMRGLLAYDVRRWRDEFVASLSAAPAG
ncbi:MAG TPA: trehalose-6-phosphate synthase, partial [Nevskiaceae bacterium]|nr:trehalose-6-phosphate synthase [Nevskiaceae bacterium]